MHSWPAPVVPSLPGQGLPLRLHDTATGEVRATAPGPEARIYVCGITPYDATHMGHAATYVAFDLVQRVWLDAGHDVHYVQNVTDVDDPLLARALETGDDWEALADRETQLFREDMTALRVLPPRHYIGAVESIPAVIAYIEKLQAAGAVYDVDGDLYFRVHTDERLRLGRGAVRGARCSRSSPSAAATPTARARSTRSTACSGSSSARASRRGTARSAAAGPAGTSSARPSRSTTSASPLDVQGGGSDLAFPHHEMGAAEAQVATGLVALRAALHARRHGAPRRREDEQVARQPRVRLPAARRRHDPAAIRLAILAHHYRERLGLDRRRASPRREDAARRVAAAVAAPRQRRPAEPVLDAVRRALADDLDAPGALAAIDRWAEQTRLGSGAPVPRTRRPAPSSRAGRRTARSHALAARRVLAEAAAAAGRTSAGESGGLRGLAGAAAQVALELAGDRVAARPRAARRCRPPPRAGGRTPRSPRPRRRARRRRSARPAPPRAGRRAAPGRRAGPRSRASSASVALGHGGCAT